MRPQDPVVLLKIISQQTDSWQYRDLAYSLFMSTSEVAESLNRSHLAGLIDESKKKVHRQSLMEFLQYGLQYVFPQIPGSMVTGIPTAHSHPFYCRYFKSEMNYVWPDENGNIRGLAIQPLYKNVVKAVQMDDKLYLLLASLDIIRVGRVRELKIAIEELRKAIL